ncbi:probable WRKY transcription factor 2 [Zingiber officinale]|uniref:probable WRKY transcription factor 2 n=1 Tax=Zingiber officinale TaxID=94328 RepID=UPI001C4CBDB3|nr:probable WRKY transcription factor 2 [Zingiber officinale]
MTDFNNFKSYFLTNDQGLQLSQNNDQNFLLRQSQHQNQAALHIDIPHSTDPRQFLNFDNYANNAILSDDANAQMMRSNELLESEQYALAMIEKYDNNDNNNENQLENEVEGVVAKPLTRKISKAIGNPPSDGYNWRKYGQKNVKGNNFPRNYYKCTYPNCEAKKKVEYSAEGYAAEIIYKGSHDHPQVNPSSDLVSIYLAQEMAYNLDNEVDNDLRNRRLDQYVATSQMSSSSRSVRQQKWVAQLVSDHEVLDDGYRWRKYGKKIVKGNLKPRDYYMCTHHGCIVKKHVEKEVDDHNRNILLITYEGLHNHGIPTTKHNIDNNLCFPFDHHNQANNLQFETRVDAPTTTNREERFMRFECPNPLNTVRATSISVEQCPRPNLGYRPIIMPYVGIRGPLEPKVEHTQEFNASSSRTQLPMEDNVLQGCDMTVTMAPSQSR